MVKEVVGRQYSYRTKTRAGATSARNLPEDGGNCRALSSRSGTTSDASTEVTGTPGTRACLQTVTQALAVKELRFLGCKFSICKNPGRMQVGKLLNFISNAGIGLRTTTFATSSQP